MLRKSAAHGILRERISINYLNNSPDLNAISLQNKTLAMFRQAF